MNISEVSSTLENIPLPPDQKKAILQLSNQFLGDLRLVDKDSEPSCYGQF